MDQGQLDALYQQYLGRNVDPNGLATWGNADPNTVIQGILGSQEYANRNQASAPAPSAPSGPANDITSIYQQYLGRAPDASGINTYAGWNPQDIINAVTSSQEYANRVNSGAVSGAGQSAPSGPIPASEAPSWLLPADYVANGYAAPYTQSQVAQKVDPSWIRQMNGQTYASIKGPSDLSGGEYLVNPSTGKFVTDANGNPVGVTYPQSNGFSDWVTTPLGSLALTFGAPLAAMGGVAALEGLGAATGAGIGAGEAAGAVGQALPYTEAFDAANLYANGITNAGQLGDILASTGMDPFLAADMGNLAAQGLSAEQIAQVMGYSYTPAELAGTGIQSFLPAAAEAAGAGLSASTLANALKAGSALAGLGSKLLGGSSGSTTGTNPMSTALKGYTPTTAMTGAQNPSTFGLIKGNVNPFAYAKDVPTQTLAQSKADPFAALNVPQTPIQPYNPLAHLVG